MIADQTRQQGLTTVPKAARFLSVSRNTLYALVNSGNVPHRKIGRSVRISWDWLYSQSDFSSAIHESEVAHEA